MKRKAALCSFCRKSPEHVGPLVEGPGAVYICGDCIELCQSIIAQERRRRSADTTARLPSPLALRSRLDQCVHGQDAAKEALVAVAAAHYAEPRSEPPRPVLLLGPSSTAKLALARALAHILEVPFKELNAESLSTEPPTEPQGDDGRTDRMSVELLQNADFDLEAARRTTVFVDAVDQPAVQDALLRPWDGRPRRPTDFRVVLRELLVVCGANVQGIGAERAPSASHLTAHGMNPTLAAEFGAIVHVAPLDEPSVRRLVEVVDFGKLSPLWETSK